MVSHVAVNAADTADFYATRRVGVPNRRVAGWERP
jgi:hypothetical protein